MTEKAPTIVNMHTAPDIAADVPAAWTHSRRALTPALRDAGPGCFGMGRLGMGAVRVPPSHSACPAHTHLQADEVFVVLEGQGLFRYGDRVHEIGPGDCISCPADTGIAHQIANPATPDGTGDLVYLAIGAEPPGGRLHLSRQRRARHRCPRPSPRLPARGGLLRGAATTHAASDARPQHARLIGAQGWDQIWPGTDRQLWRR